MRKGRFDNKALDTAGQRLIAANRRPSVEVDRVINDPLLFTRVKARIAVERALETPRSSSVGFSTVLQRRAAVFATVAVLFTLAAGFIANRLMSREKVTEIGVAAHAPGDADSSLPPHRVDEIRAQVTPDPAPRKSEFKFEKAVYRKPVARAHKAVKTARIPAEADFYAISYTGDPGETDGGGRIVRVEMQRSSLFALGINLPLENDDGPIKADLLIGRDGVTRAIRVVE